MGHAAGRNDPCPCGSGRKFKKCCSAPQSPSVDEQLRLAVQRLQEGRLQEADVTLEKILVEQPEHADALHLSGHVADRLGDSLRAFDRLERAIQHAPRNAAYFNSLGIAHGRRARNDEAIAAFRQALTLRPGHHQALNNLATQLVGAGEFDEAEQSYRRLLEIAPGSAESFSNLAQLLQLQGRLDEADRLYERALQLDPLNPAAHGGRIAVRVYHPGAAPGDVLAAARQFAEPHERALAVHRRAHRNEPDPGKRIRIGYVSPDFRRHSVAYFIEPLLAQHDHGQFEVFCYSTGALRDRVTERLEPLADHWVAVGGLADDVLAERIRADGIDILMDLSGHGAGNRLLLFARKPAPIQMTWFGFLATTGLASMDYRLTDSVADPEWNGDAGHAERLIRLPRSCLCYRPPAESPPVAPLPAAAKGFVTFGSFNTPSKYNPRVVELWASILKALPDSRLLLKGRGLDAGALRIATLAAFATAGVAAERLVLQPHESDEIAHLRRYDEIDIGLDPFPHNGVTTTCAALWMGVPVVALCGDRHSARMCASVLTNAGLPEYVADNIADYRALALSSSGDLPRLAALRAGLRERLRGSALMDEVGVTREVEAAYRAVWQGWCRERRG
jgi:protein O-GlcNAc transferase